MAQATPFLVWPVAHTTLSFQVCPVSGTGFALPNVTGYTLPNVPNGTGYTFPRVANGTGYILPRVACGTGYTLPSG